MPSQPDAKGVSAVVAIILLVGITVVLTGFLYVIVTNIAQDVEGPPPRVLLTNVDSAGGVWKFAVSAAEVRPLSEFQIRLFVDGALDAPSEMNPVAPGSSGNVTFVDGDGGGRMTTGDAVNVDTAPGHAYRLYLLWKGAGVHNVAWET